MARADHFRSISVRPQLDAPVVCWGLIVTSGRHVTVAVMTNDVAQRQLDAAMAEILATEATGQPMTSKQVWALARACEPLGIDYQLHLNEVRDNAGSPNGRHGPFPGERCVYCYSNVHDVDLYTVDPDVCPPVWSCGATHPDSRIPHCRLVPDHAGLHRYEFLEWPEVPEDDNESGDNFDFVMPEGPPLLRVLTWA